MASKLDEIFSVIRAEVESGSVPWHKPWVANPNGVVSHATGKPYSLRNRMLLQFAGEYATFHQVNMAGGAVNKGAKSRRVYFASYVKRRKDKDSADDKDTFFYMLKAFPVFHISDTTLQPKWEHKWGSGRKPDGAPYSVAENYCKRNGVRMYLGGDSAFYSPSEHSLQVPPLAVFSSEVEFYSTLFHECVHSTAKTLERECGGTFGSSDYAREELVAEIGAALCLGHFGIDTEDSRINSAAYIRHWQKEIHGMKSQDFALACSEAERAYRFILNININTDKESNNEE